MVSGKRRRARLIRIHCHRTIRAVRIAAPACKDTGLRWAGLQDNNLAVDINVAADRGRDDATPVTGDRNR